MNKTLSVSIGGLNFTIEEDAYDILRAYLNQIQHYFKDKDESAEILSDIEYRIAELLSEKISQQKNVIISEDIESVIQVMGAPEDYIEDQDSEYEASSDQPQYSSKKRLYRDIDDRILGGVASGFAYYLGVNVLWVRLFLIISTFAFGFSAYIYVILWAVLPAATTASERLAMKGEPINFKNIGKTIEEEAKEFNSRIKKKDFGSSLERLFKGLGKLFSKLFYALKKLIGLLFFTLGLIFITAIAVFIINPTIEIDGFNVYSGLKEALPYAFGNIESYEIFSIGMILLILIPVATLLYSGAKMLFNVRYPGLDWVLVSLFIISVVILSFETTRLVNSFSREEIVLEKTMFPKIDTLYLKVLPMKELVKTYKYIRINDSEIFGHDDENFYIKSPKIAIASTAEKAHFITTKEAYDNNDDGARERARNIEYITSNLSDTIFFDSYYSFRKDDKIRGQNIKSELFIPIGQHLFIDDRTQLMITNLKHEPRHPLWKMTQNGLKPVY